VPPLGKRGFDMCPQACPDLVRFITERAAFWTVLLICTSRESFRGSLLEQLLRQRPRPILGGVFLLGRFGLVSRLADHEPVPVAFCMGPNRRAQERAQPLPT
jgi:hypothetical protein